MYKKSKYIKKKKCELKLTENDTCVDKIMKEIELKDLEHKTVELKNYEKKTFSVADPRLVNKLKDVDLENKKKKREKKRKKRKEKLEDYGKKNFEEVFNTIKIKCEREKTNIT